MPVMTKTKPCPPKRVGRPPLTENPRHLIISTAAEMFAQNGYESSSLGTLASKMGMSKAAIYHYFSTKQDIYDAIILDVLNGLIDAVAVQVAQEDTATRKLRAFMVAHTRYFEAHHNEFVAMLIGFSGMTAVEYKQEAMRLRDKYEHMLREIIDQGMRSEEFAPTDATVTTRCVLSMLNWMVRWFKPGAGASAEHIALEYFHLLMHGLEPRNPPFPLPDPGHAAS